MEHHDLVDPVQKFRFKQTAYLFHNIRLHSLVILLLILSGHKSQLLRLNNRLSPRVGSHNDDRLLEIHLSSMCVCDMAVVQYLKENIKHVRMGFLNLVEQKNAVRIPPYFFTELSSLVISYISGRRTDQL